MTQDRTVCFPTMLKADLCHYVNNKNVFEQIGLPSGLSGRGENQIH